MRAYFDPGDTNSLIFCSGDLMGFIGALGTGPTTFWLPSVIWLVLKKPSVRDWNFWASWTSITLGVAVTVLGAIGGLRGIINDASSEFFSSILYAVSRLADQEAYFVFVQQCNFQFCEKATGLGDRCTCNNSLSLKCICMSTWCCYIASHCFPLLRKRSEVLKLPPSQTYNCANTSQTDISLGCIIWPICLLHWNTTCLPHQFSLLEVEYTTNSAHFSSFLKHLYCTQVTSSISERQYACAHDAWRDYSTRASDVEHLNTQMPAISLCQTCTCACSAHACLVGQSKQLFFDCVLMSCCLPNTVWIWTLGLSHMIIVEWCQQQNQISLGNYCQSVAHWFTV